MEISVLGPVEVSTGGRPVAIGAGKPRALLTLLALHEGSTVSTDRLVEGLWGEQPPATAAKMVQLAVSQLRKALADGEDRAEIVTRGRGYELRLGTGGLDARRFEEMIAAGRPREALALWRGAPLADVADEPFAVAEIRRLEGLRLAALELAIDLDLAAGRHREVVSELEALVAEEPLRERLHAHRMLALYRSGRQADALEAYRDARRVLVEAIGIEPGPELRRLHEAILRQDPELEPRAEAEAGELPPELSVGPPLALVGREAELDWLREHWRRAHGGTGRLVLVLGVPGIGKTRLAAELAVEVQRDRAAVLYGSGVGAPAAARAVLDGARAARRPTLVVLDDLDRAGDEVRGALAELADVVASLPVLVLATAGDTTLATAVRADATLALGPLDAAGVAAIAGVYAAAREDVELPVARLVAASGGVPQRIHRVAGEWARTEAARSLNAAAGRAASERAGLRAAEDELAGNVVEVQAQRERAAPAERGTHRVVVCPFKGLASFDVEDAGFFFGRERLVAEMVARLAGAPLMGIVGPSGSGKSSVLRAGLLPALAEGVLPGSENWSLALLRPGEHPTRALDDATGAASSHGRLVFAVDQFEEVFTACRDERERAAFVDVLVASARDPRRRAVVLVAVRADFYGRCASYPELWRLLGANQVPVGPMRRAELRRAIELPAQRAGLEIEPDLTDALIADVDGEPGALPLLSTSLLELWQHRDGQRLRMAAYDRAGGVHGAVARLAERAYERLDASQQQLARVILLRLAGEGRDDAVVRARVALEEFGGAAAPVLAELAGSRLVTLSEGTVEVAHEALLREWPRLRGWLEDDAEGRRMHRHLRTAAKEWEAADHDPGELYRGSRLESALDWATAHNPEPNDLERAFLDHSQAASEQAHRRLRTALAVVAFFLVLAVIAGVVALNERGNARDEAVAADAQRLGAQALAENDLDRSLLLARQGVALDDSRQTRSNLLAALLKSPAAIGVLRGDGDRLISLDLSPDGRTLAFIDNDGTLSFADAPTRRPAGPPVTVGGHTGVIGDSLIGVDEVRFSNDGSRLAVGLGEPVVLDARTHRVLARLRLGNDPNGRFIYATRFSPDGRTLYEAVALAPDRGTIIQRFDARTGQRLGAGVRISEQRGNVTLMVTRDGRRLVTTSAEGPTVIRDARTLRALRPPLRVGAQAATLSSDDRTMLVGARDGSVRFLDLRTGHGTIAAGHHDGPVVHATFSADGAFAITAGEDGRVIVWDVRHAAPGETVAAHAGQITGLALTRDTSTLYTTSLDGKVVIWDLAGSRRLGRRFTVAKDRAGLLLGYALSHDGRTLAVGHDDGTVTLTDARTLARSKPFRVVKHGQVRGLAFAPGDRLLAVAGDHGFLALVDPRRGAVVTRLGGHCGRPCTRTSATWPNVTPSFTADGRLMATARDGYTVRLWDLPSGRQVGRPLRFKAVGAVSLSPDGRTLAVTVPEGARNPGVEILDVATRRRRASLSEDETVWDVAQFTPDGRFLVGGSYKGWVRLWSTKTWKPATRVLAGHAGAVIAQSMSIDGRTLATGSADGTLRLWDLRTQQPLGAPLPGLPGRGVAPLFTPDGAYLFAIYDAGRAYRWDVRPSSWARHACDVAGRPLTRAEWKDALPERPYTPACNG
jgi:DNA-binding SARP family transcriptional activator/WD40 repeat protein